MASLGGWLLSAVGMLNAGGYLVFFAIAGLIWWQTGGRVNWTAMRRNFNWKRIRRCFRRPLPCAFAILAVLIFLGGVLYAPSNHTALTYRFPRVLSWLAEGHWYWIHTPDYRMNNRACGIEWLSAPLLLFAHSTRGIFLLNLIPFLLLPGLIFSVCTRLGVRSRVAWHWMWLLPTGYNFVLQAGSAGNDTFPTVYALAAVDFACRAYVSRRPSDVWLSMLSVALLTGAKASNLPLLLPWAILILPTLPIVRRYPLQMAGITLISALVSFLPTALLNIKYCGDWSGLKMEHAGMSMKNPLVGIWGNLLLFCLHNFAPPFFPQASWWNQHALSVLPKAIEAPLSANFEATYHLLGEIPTEDWVGTGLGVSLLMVVAVLYRLLRRPGVDNDDKSGGGVLTGERHLPEWFRRAGLVTPWMALLAYCMKSGMVTGARLISPYYPLLLPLLIIGKEQSDLVRRRCWQAIALGVYGLTFVVLITTPGRPLWPAQTVLSKAVVRHPGQRALTRALTVYRVYGERPDPLREMRGKLPPGLEVVGFMGTEDDIDISLWHPLGSRRVVHVLPADSAEELRAQHLEYAVVSGFNLKEQGVELGGWLSKVRGEVAGTINATQKVSEGLQPWYLVRLR